MSNSIIFIVGLVVTLITTMGVVTSQIFTEYAKIDIQSNIDSNFLDVQNETI